MEPDFCYNARIMRVIDGDTYDVEVDLGFRIVTRLPLRLAHVDCAERFTEAGKLASAFVSRQIGPLPAPVVVHTHKPLDKYGRYLADVFIGQDSFEGQDSLSDRLVAAGLATPYEGGKKR